MKAKQPYYLYKHFRNSRQSLTALVDFMYIIVFEVETHCILFFYYTM